MWKSWSVYHFLDSGADMNARNNEGHTALMGAAECDNKDAIEVLITAGTDVNARNNEGYTALRYARENSHTEIVDILVRAGARE